jgi:methyl coenzyme M reductase gamma subunit
VFDEFITKGREYVHKVGRTLANQVDERRNMINDYLTRRACIERVGGVDFRESVDLELLL